MATQHGEMLAMMVIMTAAVGKAVMKMMIVCKNRRTGGGAYKLSFQRIFTF